MNELDKIVTQCSGNDLAFCVASCPIHVDMKGANLLIRDGKFAEALKTIRVTLPFAGVMGRICTHPCEDVCRRKDLDQTVPIMLLKRAAADYGAIDWDLAIATEKKEKVAVIGGGPAGLMAAYELRKSGYQVTIFDALPVLGGMMAAGIPEFRLPRDVLQPELAIIERLGIQVKLNTRIDGSAISDLKREFDAIFLATGAPLSRRLNIDGAHLDGVLWGVDFLKEVNLHQRTGIKGRVVVIGGGNVAIDVALTARRLGASDVQVVCLESRGEMPAFAWEIRQALEEGIVLNVSWGPGRIRGDGTKVTGVELVRCTSVFDKEGRFSPCFDSSVSTVIETDSVILAVGQAADISFPGTASGIRVATDGLISADDVSLQTSVPGIFAGGDGVTGPRSVIDALAAGKKAAISIDRYLRGEALATGRETEGPVASRLKVAIDSIATKSAIPAPTLSVPQRTGNFREVDLGYSRDEAREEAGRCLGCECRVCVRECEFLKLYCDTGTPRDLGEKFQTGSFREKPKIPYSCNLCSLCKVVCPEGLCVGDACAELRGQLVAEKLGPLPQHKYIDWNLEWGTPDSFVMAQPDLKTGNCQRVFFPGCNLPGYSPTLTIKTLDFLREKLPGTGVLLNCCGAPRRDLAEMDRFRKILNGIEAGLTKLGATEVIVPCANCYRTFKNFVPNIRVRSLYEVLAETGLPDGIKTKDWTFSLYDPCTARFERGIQDSARELVRKMGYRIEEMKHSRELTRCCGMGGMVPYADIGLSFNMGKRLADEACHDVITYCATCREALANPDGAALSAIHLLDLIFNPDWEQARLVPPNIGVTRRQNRADVKKLLLAREGPADTPAPKIVS